MGTPHIFVNPHPDTSLPPLLYLSDECLSDMGELINHYQHCFAKSYSNEASKKITSLKKRVLGTIKNEDVSQTERFQALRMALKEYKSAILENYFDYKGSQKIEWYISTSELFQSEPFSQKLGTLWHMQAKFAHYSPEALLEAWDLLKNIKLLLVEANNEFKGKSHKFQDEDLKKAYGQYLDDHLKHKIPTEEMGLIYSMLTRLALLSERQSPLSWTADIILNATRKLLEQGIEHSALSKAPTYSSLRPMTSEIFNQLNTKVFQYISNLPKCLQLKDSLKTLDLEGQFKSLSWISAPSFKDGIVLYKKKIILMVPHATNKEISAITNVIGRSVFQMASVFEIAEYQVAWGVLRQGLNDFNQKAAPWFGKSKTLTLTKPDDVRNAVQSFFSQNKFSQSLSCIIRFFIDLKLKLSGIENLPFKTQWNKFIQEQTSLFFNSMELLVRGQIALLSSSPFDYSMDINLFTSFKFLVDKCQPKALLEYFSLLEKALSVAWKNELNQVGQRKNLDAIAASKMTPYLEFFNIWYSCASKEQQPAIAVLLNLLQKQNNIQLSMLTSALEKLYSTRSLPVLADLLRWLVLHIEDPGSSALKLMKEYDKANKTNVCVQWADRQRIPLGEAMTLLVNNFPLQGHKEELEVEAVKNAVDRIVKYSVQDELSPYLNPLLVHLKDYLKNPLALANELYLETVVKLENQDLLDTFAEVRSDHLLNLFNDQMIEVQEPLCTIFLSLSPAIQQKINQDFKNFCHLDLLGLTKRFRNWELLKKFLKAEDATVIGDRLSQDLVQLIESPNSSVKEFKAGLKRIQEFGLSLPLNFFTELLKAPWTLKGHHIINMLHPPSIPNYRLCWFRQFLQGEQVGIGTAMVWDDLSIQGFKGLVNYFGENLLQDVFELIEQFLQSKRLNLEIYSFLDKVFCGEASQDSSAELSQLYPVYKNLKGSFDSICSAPASMDVSILEEVRQERYSFALRFIQRFLIQDSQHENYHWNHYKILFDDLVDLIKNLVAKYSQDSIREGALLKDFVKPLYEMIDSVDKLAKLGGLNKLKRMCLLAPFLSRFYTHALNTTDSFIEPELFSILEALSKDRQKQIAEILLDSSLTTDNSLLKEAYGIVYIWLTKEANHNNIERDEKHLQSLLGSVYLDELSEKWTLALVQNFPSEDLSQYLMKGLDQVRKAFNAKKGQLLDLKQICAKLKSGSKTNRIDLKDLFKVEFLTRFSSRMAFYLKRYALEFNQKNEDLELLLKNESNDRNLLEEKINLLGLELEKNVGEILSLIEKEEGGKHEIEQRCDLLASLFTKQKFQGSNLQSKSIKQLFSSLALGLDKLLGHWENKFYPNLEIIEAIQRLTSFLEGSAIADIKAASAPNNFPVMELAKLSQACQNFTGLLQDPVGSEQLLHNFKTTIQDLTSSKYPPSFSEAQWQGQLQKLFPLKGEGLEVETASLGCRYLHAKAYDQLFDDKGNIREEHLKKAKDKKYRHVVPCIKIDNLTFYLKFFPDAPGIQTMTGVWETILFEEGLPSELVKFPGGVAGKKEPFAVLITPEVPGKTIHDLWVDGDEFIIDSRSYSQNFLRMLADKEHDGKGLNYIGKPTEGISDVRKLVLVDKEQAYGNPVEREKSFLSGTINLSLVTKSLLLCVENFHEPLDPQVVEEFLKIDPEAILKRFIAELAQCNKRFLDLFDLEKCREWIKQKDPIIIPAIPSLEIIAELYRTLCTTQEALHKNAKILPFDLLMCVHPNLASYCEEFYVSFPFPKNATTLEKNQNAYRCFEAMCQKGYKTVRTENVKQLNFLTTRSNLDLIKSLYGDIPRSKWGEQVLKPDVVSAKEAFDYLEKILKQRKELKGVQDQLKSGDVTIFSNLSKNDSSRLILIEQALNGIQGKLSPLQIGKLEVSTQEKILKAMVGHSFSALNLEDCNESLSTELLLQLITPSLQVLNIKGCLSIDVKIITKISALCPLLRVLNLGQLPITSLGTDLFLMKLSISFPELTYLNIEGCSQLSSLILKAPKLRKLVAKGCNRLKQLVVDSHCHSTADLEGCHSLPEKERKIKEICLSSKEQTKALRDELKIYCKDYEDPELLLQKIQDLRAKVKVVSSFQFIPYKNSPMERKLIEMIVGFYGKTLTNICLAHSKGVDDQILEFLINHCPHLEQLDLTACINFSPQPFTRLAWQKLPLKTLKLGYCDQLTDEFLGQVISSHPQLISLDLDACRQLTDKSFDLLAQKYSCLERLSLNKLPQLKDQNINRLVKFCPKLRQLEVDHEDFTHLDLTGSSLDLDSLSKLLDNNPLLEHLSLADQKKTYDKQIHFCDIETKKNHYQNLISLDLSGLGPTDLNFFRGIKLQKIKASWFRLGQSSSNLSPIHDDYSAFFQQKNLREIDIVSDKFLEKHFFGISWNHPDLDRALMAFLQGSCKHVKKIRLKGCSSLTSLTLDKIAECLELEELDLSNTDIGNASLEKITRNCQQLKVLNLSYCTQIIKGESGIKNAFALQDLDITSSYPRDMNSLDNLLANCPNLVSLKVGPYTQFYNEMVSYASVLYLLIKSILNRCTNLEKLEIKPYLDLTDDLDSNSKDSLSAPIILTKSDMLEIVGPRSNPD